jgi:pyruvate formate lyase activating enzyme
MKEAGFYEVKNGKIRCLLCPHFCIIGEGKRGVCGVRVHRDGKLWTEVYGKIIAAHLDPVEKKPLFHFFPGTRTFSIATPGCNFQCPFCQNWEISQVVDGIDKIDYVYPEEVVTAALKTGAHSISYTYTEPTIFFEFAMDTGIIARKKGLKNIFVTNGYISQDALSACSDFLDAANVDLKSFREDFYKKLCKGRLSPVLDAIKWMKSKGIWVEITTLLIPGENDDPSELRDIARFIVEIGDTTPWHISRFHPDYKFLSHPLTPSESLFRAYEIGKEEGLKFVYVGNLPGTDKENTYCPSCGKIVIGRWGFTITEKNIKEGKCIYCGQKIDGAF